ncbi:MAG: multicomponent Na+:H+ antiporter subunit [Actinomycetota bacterium]|jgi:multicomponent Na+:H+ antiporter subunit D|nr:multicomponent Na+:H+ antiporter subunit [Actinomycetota bacterium]
MDLLPPLPVVIPLLGAALLLGAPRTMRRQIVDGVALVVALAVLILCVVLAMKTSSGRLVYWFGGWKPRELGGRPIALGVSFSIDPLGAGMAALAAGLVCSALVFSWHYFKEVGNLFHVLMLVFLGAMVGFCLSGDLFNMFVFFELMSVAAYSLTAYKIEERGPLQGALNFAVTNSVGGFLLLTGLALLYARTGALNLAQIGHALDGTHLDGLVIVAFVFLMTGFLVKAAVVPFHFWLADAHSVAPTPVCMLFSGVMVELGLYGVARVYWTVFEGPMSVHIPQLREVLMAMAVVTALVGSVMCLLQHHLKRLLAFSTVSHAGLFLLGVALLQPKALGGVAIYIAAHGAVKAALFVCVGILLDRKGSVDERRIFGRGRDLPFTGVLFMLGGLALAGLPPFGTFLGKGLVEEQASELGLWWVPWLFVAVSAMTGGAVLRAAGRVFRGWGEPPEFDPTSLEEGHEDRETGGASTRTRLVMLAPAIALLAAALVLGILPSVPQRAVRGAVAFEDHRGYEAAVLGLPAASRAGSPAPLGSSFSSVLLGILGALLAVTIALIALFKHLLPEAPVEWVRSRLSPVGERMRTLHSGHVSDYIAWLTAGVAALGGLLAAALR